MMHTVLFAREPVQASCEPVIAYLDLETNSLDVLTGKIVEICALVVVCSRQSLILATHGAALGDALDDASVHGIPHEELLSAPNFPEAV